MSHRVIAAVLALTVAFGPGCDGSPGPAEVLPHHATRCRAARSVIRRSDAGPRRAKARWAPAVRAFELSWSWRPWLPAELLKDELFAAREEIAAHASGVRVSGVVRVSTTEAGVRSVDGGGGPVAAAVVAVLGRIAAHHRELRSGGVTVRFTLVPAAPPIVFEELRPVEERKVRTSRFIAW